MGLARARGIVCVVTDRRRLAPHVAEDAQIAALVRQAAAAAKAGADLFQIRERGLTDRQLHALAREVVALTAGSGMQVVINDRMDIALAAGAHGVHLPASGLEIAAVREFVPTAWLVGQSIHGLETPAGGADYAIYGTVFSSESKPADHQPAGVEALAAATRRSIIPVLAIGGITAATVAQVAPVSSGIAAIRWFATTDDRRLVEAVSSARSAFDTTTPVI